MSVRFAPSPTGDFHVGNLRTAWVSRRWADELEMPWVVRFEDIDRPRVVQGAQQKQLEHMAMLGLVPDRCELQSSNHSRHGAVFQRARQMGQIYPCTCSRKDVQEALQAMASAPHHATAVYNGHCRREPPADARIRNQAVAWRFKCDAEDGSKDFIIARTPDFMPAYHWACAIDDFDGRHALLVRAWDLAPVVEQQRAIHDWLGKSGIGEPHPAPAVFHTSLVVQENGQRLEKRTRGVTLPELLAQGHNHKMSAKDLIQKFQQSYSEDPQGFSPSRVWGEALRELSLTRLRILHG
jgi:glutamyl/glutaminyl-tRNA synthetase